VAKGNNCEGYVLVLKKEKRGNTYQKKEKEKRGNVKVTVK
jgi:hypothetical protein